MSPESFFLEGFAIENLTLSYAKTAIIEAMNLFFPLGSLISIMGPNGCGKTTFLNALGGVFLGSGLKGKWGMCQIKKEALEDCCASHCVTSVNIGNLSDPSMISFSNSSTYAYMPQQFKGISDYPLWGRDILAMGLKNPLKTFFSFPLCSFSKKNLALSPSSLEILNHLYGFFPRARYLGLENLLEKSFHEMSVGQRQKIFFCRLCFDVDRRGCDVILLDEPFAGLDEESVEIFLESIENWKKEKKIILVSQHNRQRAETYFPWSILLGNGKHVAGLTQNIVKGEVWNAFHQNFYPADCC